MYAMETSYHNDNDILEWELSLNSSDIRAHLWYHGNINRNVAESFLKTDGDFLIRDCSSGRLGDFVLSCKWNGANLHFLIQQLWSQKDTIYEQRMFRLEGESFTSVQDLITYYVGNKIIISEKSGAKIINPRHRSKPVTPRKNQVFPSCGENQYASLGRDSSLSLLPVSSSIEKTRSGDLYQKNVLDLSFPEGLLEDLGSKRSNSESSSLPDSSVYKWDLENFSSLLLPTDLENKNEEFDQEFFQVLNSHILEASERRVAFLITEEDWNCLNKKFSVGISSICNVSFLPTVYDKLAHSDCFRSAVIQRSLLFSHLVMKSILEDFSSQDEMFTKWVLIAQEIKSGMGNMYAFCSIMRALLAPDVSAHVSWTKLRCEYTSSTLQFETKMKSSFQSLIKVRIINMIDALGQEPLPPITTIPHVFAWAAILEEDFDLLPELESLEDMQLNKSIYSHLKTMRNQSREVVQQEANFIRLKKAVDPIAHDDILLQDIFTTELQIICIYGSNFDRTNLNDTIKALKRKPIE